MNDRHRILLLFVLTITTVSLLVGVTAIWFLYETAMNEQVSELQYMANEQAQLLEALARIGPRDPSASAPSPSSIVRISQIADAHGQIGGFGASGEFVIGQRQGDDIVFLGQQRFQDSEGRRVIPFEGTDWAEPMRLALSGQSGWTVGRDYRGKIVLAAYRPLPGLNSGLVVKKDLSEVRAPFVRAAILASAVALMIILFGATTSWQITAPLVLRIQYSEAKVRTILNNAAEGILSCDIRGRIASYNPSAEKLFGYTQAEALAMTVDEIIPGFSLMGEQAETTSESAPTVRPEAVYRGRRKDGSLVDLDVNVGQVGQSWYRGFTIIVRDISEELRSRAEREELITELENKNAELERYAYAISHDLKGPLITAKGCVDLLAYGGSKDDVDQRCLNRMDRAVGRMLRMIDELLDLSRIGQSVSISGSVSLDEIAHETVSLLAGSIEQAKAEVEILPGLPSVRGDRMRLSEVMQNLLENSLKYMGDQPHPHIQIGSAIDDSGVTCFVRDNGIGIDPEHHEAVFGLYKKLDSATDGSGVGLALAKRIVEAHGGRIWIESKGRGFGSSFCFHLPNVTDAGSFEEVAVEADQK